MPRVFFPYAQLPWLVPLPGNAMYGVYAAMFALAILVAIGFAYRASAAALAVLFTYAHLADTSNYLNHYYLVSLLLVLASALPLHACASIDAHRRPEAVRGKVRMWMVWLVRFQIGVVYFFGGVGKLQRDWLECAMPLAIWLRAAGDFPVVGSLLRLTATAWLMSWAGALFDLATPFLLACRRTRAFGYALACAFHLMTARLFQIGMFPWIMMASALVFFEPSWPRRWRAGTGQPLPARVADRPDSLRGAKAWLVAFYVMVQLLVPLRSWLYSGNVLWTERGYRFSWRVMLIEKTGSVELTLRDPVTGREHDARVRDHLTPFQVKMMSTQPDMIAAFAEHLADVAEARGERRPRVLADALVVLNGRPPARLVDPTVDLADAGMRSRSASWILPAPDPHACARSLR